MKKEVHSLSEKEVQRLIADYPWLLNLEYEIIPELKNNGMEYLVSDNKRVDLILRDGKSGRPVIVEFKAGPFYRENIGQILEYKARIIQELINEDSSLKDLFGQRLLTPILILVVSECDAEARLACNLSNIDIYEYDKIINEIAVPENKKSLEDFNNILAKGEIPITVDRTNFVDGIYRELKDFLDEEGLKEGWKNYKAPAGEYFYNINHLFINKELFKKLRMFKKIY